MDFLLKIFLTIVVVSMFAALVVLVESYRSKRIDGVEAGFFSWLFILVSLLFWMYAAQARDLDGRYANSPLKDWFEGLKSSNGPCCSFADGTTVDDPDWESKDGHYRVRLEGEWIDVPDTAVITEPNRAGRTIVWPYRIWHDNQPSKAIRCFIPGSMT